MEYIDMAIGMQQKPARYSHDALCLKRMMEMPREKKFDVSIERFISLAFDFDIISGQMSMYVA